MTVVVNSTPTQKVGALLGYGILFLPFVFVWTLTKKGYSTLARVASFVWLGVFLIAAYNAYGRPPGSGAAAPAAPPSEQAKAVSEAPVLTAVIEKIPAPETPTAPPPVIEPSTKWTYRSDADEMRGSKTRYASVESDTYLTLGFPYDPGPATLTIRERSTDGLSIMLSIDGQFMCRSYDDDTVSVKFDDGPIETYGCSEPSSGTTGLLFIDGEQRFVKKLRSAKKVIIEAEVYQAGNKQIAFSPAGLKW